MEIYKTTTPNEWRYFAKGSANILFKYCGNNDYLTHKLLRLRLVKKDEEYISTCELYDFIELKCKHLFDSTHGQVVINIQLVVLTNEFVANLDSCGFQLQLNERYGLLLPNILDGEYVRFSLSKNCQLYINNNGNCSNNNSNNNNKNNNNNITAEIDLYNGCQSLQQVSLNTKINSIIFEIKPKWLYDNTSSNYCRTCSHNQLRNVSRHFCPLDLLYPQTIDQGISDIFALIPQSILTLIEEKNQFPIRQLFHNYLATPNNIFIKLKECQKICNKQDQIGSIRCADDVSQHLSLVMTLRDVGLFIKFEKFNPLNNTHNSHNNINNLYTLKDKKYLITCNIYDLDLKSKMKYKHWLKVEEELKAIYNSNNPSWPHCVRVEP
ncbi:IPK1 [Candida oxycetoniae]|uniref:Inositol-pentakisphosphate 2-kinase n=1 Tax=Candida oxycetoniae TaxID=497107 RepID=A0AAI9WZZ3_9ASCO|nr:IPK1 [Candida oxycetoniae]KAI3406713.2 IPK1 [Candida oxycetoniae]